MQPIITTRGTWYIPQVPTFNQANNYTEECRIYMLITMTNSFRFVDLVLVRRRYTHTSPVKYVNTVPTKYTHARSCIAVFVINNTN